MRLLASTAASVLRACQVDDECSCHLGSCDCVMSAVDDSVFMLLHMHVACLGTVVDQPAAKLQLCDLCGGYGNVEAFKATSHES